MNHNRLIAKNTVILSARTLIAVLIMIYTTRLLLEGLGIEDFGAYNITVGIISMCSFLKPALANGIQRFFNFEIGTHDFNRAKSVFNTGMQIQIIIVVIFIIICETAGLWYVEYKLVVPPERHYAVMIVYQVSIIILSLTMLEAPFIAAIIGHEKMDFYAIISILGFVFRLIIAFAIKYASVDRLILYSFLLLLEELYEILSYAIYTLKKYKEIRFHTKFDKSMFVSMLSFSGWNILNQLSIVGKDQGVNMVLNYFFGPVLNASRAVVNQVMHAFTILAQHAVTASQPQTIQSYAVGDCKRTIRLMVSLSKFIYLLLLILIIPVFLESSYILNIWLGNMIPPLVVPLLNISLITIVFTALVDPIQLVIFATGKVKKYNIISSFINVLAIPFSILVLMEGADATHVYLIVLLLSIIALGLFVFLLKEYIEYRVSDYIKEIVLPLFIVTVISVFLSYMTHAFLNEGFIRLVVVSLTSLLGCGGLSYYVALSPSERAMAINMVNSVKRKWYGN